MNSAKYCHIVQKSPQKYVADVTSCTIPPFIHLCSKVKEMHLQELKSKSAAELLAYAEELEIENASTLRTQDMMFAILKQ